MVRAVVHAMGCGFGAAMKDLVHDVVAYILPFFALSIWRGSHHQLPVLQGDANGASGGGRNGMWLWSSYERTGPRC
jgi:hypothetical protein